MVLVVFSDHDLNSTGHTGANGNAPEERKRLVQKALRTSQKCRFLKIEKPEASLVPLGSIVHDYGMLLFFENAWEAWEREWSKKPNNHLIGVFCSENSDAKDPHPPPFVTGYAAPRTFGQKPSKHLFGQACFYSMDRETPIHSSTTHTLKWDLAVTKEVVRQVSKGIVRIAYAQITHPGHHAGSASYGGFCFINQAAIAVELLKQEKFKRVAVIDVDYHAGNGTMSIFWNDPAVFFASIHGDPEIEYPFNSGFADQNGGESAQGTTLNIPLPGKTNWATYKQHLKKVIEEVKRFNAQALVVSLGVDTLRDDPVALPEGRFCLDPRDYIEMGEMLLNKDLCLPTVVIQEGGYKLDDVPYAITAFLTGTLPGSQSFL